MLLSDDRRERLAAVPFDYAGAEKQPVDTCNLCGGDVFVVVAHRDRYGYPATAHCCRRCGLVFLNPMLTQDAYAHFYRDVYRPLVSAFHGRRIDAETVEEEQHAYAAALADLLEPFLRDERDPRDLLDVGGSTGVVAAALTERFGLRPAVLDPAPAEADRAAGRGIEAIVGTIESWDPHRRSFGVITMCQTVDHLLDVGGTLAKLRSVIEPGGLLFVDIVDFRAAYLRNGSVEGALKVDHPYSLTEATMEAFLARAGFRVLRVDYAADHLHVGYVCAPAVPEDVLPSAAGVEALLREMRTIQNALRP